MCPEGCKKLRFPDYVTMAQDGGKLSALRTGRFNPRKYSWYSFVLVAECQWKIPVTLSGIKPTTFRFVAQHLNHRAAADRNFLYSQNKAYIHTFI